VSSDLSHDGGASAEVAGFHRLLLMLATRGGPVGNKGAFAT
jgi:hypothetical protein